ncbi:hypothetical protein G6F57_005592 [Rhizopus arrhizus]|uniref:Molybdopterin synthase catalytic subunit n=1 Tax=Rhizopus oryzae TaxID=64495 RepID=A0A9P7BSD4_RHIOR|nr:hypothetical protein G6F23_004562 [Rhizopus arrhizus]KAG1416118.1 hypothetical protein G6F58_006131 [Rhizopus delemar]KAG0763287.1 hypothetical protein G6F24_006139 [Rhizopus arrhizus]KAG0792947.1 hypothetical protein G6F21_003985 [Rhizopus arrhizus]KAG0812408.1 hypothetical protein G6F20_006388 [Rhizopus arrhizus]
MTKDIVEITSEDIPSLDYISSQVHDDSAGAISTFSGTTRNTFEDKEVIKLDYEAYEPMAKKVLLEIITDARKQWNLKHIAIYHRTGTVPVGQVSVVIAISSTHRGDAMHATEYLIDELKSKCPIWKREVYRDGSVWKGSCTK